MRGGVLSDLAIQSAYPEFQAPNLGLASALEMIVMDKHEFLGIKLPKDIKRKRVSRFPINDIANLASIGGVDNKAKTLYASVKGYRKKLGSSNFDLEDRQHMFKELDKRMGADYGMNQELKRRGGFVDIIDAKSAISQEQLVSNLARQNINVLKVNQKIRDSGLGLQRVESQLNSSLLNNLENAKVNSIKQNTLIAQDERFRRLSGGEVYYNALTQKDYNLRRTLPDDRFKALREDEFEKSMEMEYNVTDITKYKEMLKLAGARDAKEYEEITGMPLLETIPPIKTTEEYIGIKTKPKFNEKAKTPNAKRQKELEDLPDDPTMDKNRKPITKPHIHGVDPIADMLMTTPSEQSMRDPAIKDLPKDIEGNIDLTEYIRKREQAKMKNKSYATKEQKEQTRIMGLSSQKSQDKYTLTPSQYRETYGMTTLEQSRDSMTKLGQELLDVKQTLRQDYSKFSSEQAAYEYGRNEQLFEDYERATQLNIPIHGIDPYQN
jgi:hypothetical protein